MNLKKAGRRLLSVFFLLVFTSGLAALAACDDASQNQHEGASIQVQDAWARLPLTQGGAGAAYMTIVNHGPDAELVAARSSVAERVEIHSTRHDGHVMRMRKVANLKLASGETVEFRPGGFHLMLFGLNPESVSDSVPLTLVFANGTEVSVDAQTKSPTHSSDDMSDGMDGTAH